MFLEVVSQAAQGPAFLEAETSHFVVGLIGRQTQKVHFVKRRNKGSAVASDGARKVDRPKTLI